MLDFERNEMMMIQHHPLGDISNRQIETNNNSMLKNELEDLIFGSTSNEINNVYNENSHKYIKDSLEAEAGCCNLIGDRTRKHLLPFKHSTKHQDLFCITPETLVSILDGHFENDIDKCIIIDSRYPYEYEGGHIASARNIFTREKLLDELFVHKIDGNTNGNVVDHSVDAAFKASDKRVIIIFHCEFSSERGPGL